MPVATPRRIGKQGPGLRRFPDAPMLVRLKYFAKSLGDQSVAQTGMPSFFCSSGAMRWQSEQTGTVASPG
ncbi:hypothetical protein D9M68_837400 [compost metagenome]